MNKISIPREMQSRKLPAPMRVIFKNRNNYKEKHQLQSPHSQSKPSLQDSRLSSSAFDDNSLTEVKKHVRNRFRTQYSDKFGGISTTQIKVDAQPNQQNTANDHNISARSTNPLKNQLSHRSLNAVHLSNQTNHPSDIQIDAPNHQQTRRNQLNLQEIEAALEGTLDKRLRTCLQFKKATDWNEDFSIKQLIAAVKQLRNRTNADDIEDPSTSAKRIILIQKIMAQNSVQSEILKKYYFSKITSPLKKAKTGSLHTIETINCNPEENSWRPKVSFIKTTANRDSFKRPDSNAYKIYHHHRGFFNADKHLQPLPRSSYGRDFLDYKNQVPRIPVSRPQESYFMKASQSEKKIQSSYQQEFRPKTVQKINPKELDACKNKIKNLQISFGKKERQDMVSKLHRYLLQKRHKTIAEKSPEVSFIKNALLTQSRRQFQSQKSASPSKIKHENLVRLKYSYKNKFHV